MPKPFHQLTIEQFAELLASFPFTRRLDAVHMHHTWQPEHSQYRGVESIESMWRHHTQSNGWSDIAQHISIAPDGTIWTGRNWNRPPASASGHNGNEQSGPFMFETIGNFDIGHDPFEGAQKRTVLEVIARVQHHAGLPVESLRFHNSMSSKSCPGTSIDYSALCAEVRTIRERLTNEGTGAVSRSASPFGEDQRAIWDVMEDLRKEVPGLRGADEINADVCERCTPPAGRRTIPATRAESARGDQPLLAPEVLNRIRPHVVNLNQGRFSTDGEFQSDAGSVDSIFDKHLEKELERAAGKKLRIVFYAHGGLTSEQSALWMTSQHLPWWRANNIYPIFFVWETGLKETLTQLFSRPAARALDFEEVKDRVLQTVARSLGGVKIWSGMKVSAERSVDPENGAALYVATKLAAFMARHNANGRERVEAHAVGHSAGSIFHAYFAPAAIQLGCTFKTMHFLAPAIRTDTFKALLAPHVGQGIQRLSIFTMSEDYEKQDTCGPYKKSLLYLIFHALEPERGRPTPILGLDESLRNDPQLAAMFNYHENDPQAAGDIVWSVSEASDGPSASHCTTHGGFNEDIPTMTSVALRILDASEAEKFPNLTAREIHTLAALSEDEPDLARWLDGATMAPMPEFSAPMSIGGSPFVKPPRPSTPIRPNFPIRPNIPATSGGSGKRRALCVGINRYPTAPLGGCVADAQAWQGALQQLGFATKLLVDQQATRAGIVAELERLVTASQPGDVIAFQFAGHGTQLRDLNGDEAGGDSPGEDEALCPFDFAQGRFLIDDDLGCLFNRVPAGVSITCFTDCCHSGTITRLAVGTPPGLRAGTGDVRARYIPPTPELEDAHAAFRETLPADRAGQATPYGEAPEVLFSACRSIEVALESNGHGHFTTKALQVLAADVEGLTNEELARRIVRAFGSAPSQHPELHCATPHRAALLFATGVSGNREVQIASDEESEAGSGRYSVAQVAELLKAFGNGHGNGNGNGG